MTHVTEITAVEIALTDEMRGPGTGEPRLSNQTWMCTLGGSWVPVWGADIGRFAAELRAIGVPVVIAEASCEGVRS